MSGKLLVVDHPLVSQKLAGLRDRRTQPERFRILMEEMGALLAYEALRSVKIRRANVTTPMGVKAPSTFVGQPVCAAAILRAGLGFLPGVLRVDPSARIGHIGMYRNEETLNPLRYYVRLPKDLAQCFVLLCDPMLATGGSAVEGIDILKTDGAKQVTLMSLIASRVGIERVRKAHPDVNIVVAGVDNELNKKGYIVPGLGDAGDRLFAT